MADIAQYDVKSVKGITEENYSSASNSVEPMSIASTVAESTNFHNVFTINMHIPNQETIEAIEEFDSGIGIARFDTIKALYDNLDD